MKQFIFVILLAIICNACENRSQSSINSFDITQTIVDCDSIYSDKFDILSPIIEMEIFEDIIITQHLSSDDIYNFSFIDIKKGELITRWGHRGKGPDEYIQLCRGFTIVDSQLIFLDDAKKEINFVPISQIVKNEVVVTVTKTPYPYTVDFRPNRLTFVGDLKIVVGSFAEGRFGILDSTNTPFIHSYDYPFAFDKRLEGIYRGSVFQSHLKSNNKQGKFVISTLASDIFEIYQKNDFGVQKVFVSPFNYIPQTKERQGRFGIDSNKSIAGLMHLSVSDDLICFSYSPQIYDNYMNTNPDRESHEILCFNWAGEKVKKYILPFPISNFCLDKKYIYGVKYMEDEFILYKFKI